MIEKSEEDLIDLAYCDESHFGRFSNLPSAWQPTGKYLKLEANHEKRFTVTGILSDKYLQYWVSEKSNKSLDFVNYINSYVETLEKKTVLILDNASIHKSKFTKSFFAEWEKSGLYIFFLPPYSPHLNKIEMLWRSIKRITTIDFRTSYSIFKNKICNLLDNYIGSYYEI